MTIARWILFLALTAFALFVINDGITEMSRSMNMAVVDTIMQQQVLLLNAIANFVLAAVLELFAIGAWIVCSVFVPRKEA